MINSHDYDEKCKCITCEAFREVADQDLMKALEKGKDIVVTQHIEPLAIDMTGAQVTVKPEPISTKVYVDGRLVAEVGAFNAITGERLRPSYTVDGPVFVDTFKARALDEEKIVEIKETSPVVLGDYGIRPLGPPDACFYCRRMIGEPHKDDCVVLVRDSVYDVVLYNDVLDDKSISIGTWTTDDPADWTEDDCNFYRNESSWCASNFLGTGKHDISAENMAKLREIADGDVRCLCDCIHFNLKSRGDKVFRAEEPKP